MKDKKIRLLSLLFLLAFFLVSCSSIAKDKEPEVVLLPTETVEEPKKENNPYFDKIKNLPDEDFNGASFRIATDSSSLIVSSNTSGLVGKAQYLRNRAVEEKYNVKITFTDESGLPTIAERVRTEALAGNDYCDLLILQSKSFASLAAADLLCNVRTVPYLDLQADGIYQNSVEALTLGDMSYGFSADLLLQPETIFAVFFNRALLSQTELPDLYQMVKENQWDFENFLLYSEEAYSVSLAGGKRSYGFCSTVSTEALVNILWAGSGEPFFSNVYGERPSLVFDNETTDSFITLARAILIQSPVYSDDYKTADLKFKNGDACFLIAPLSLAEDLSKSAVSWGVVPIPKLDINQKSHYSYMTEGHCYAGFSNGTKNLKMSGLVTSALVHSSSGMQQDLAITTHLNLYASSSEDAEMLDLILSSPYYDPAEFFGKIDPSFTASTQTLLYRAISMEGRFDSLYTQYSKMLNKYLDENL